MRKRSVLTTFVSAAVVSTVLAAPMQVSAVHATTHPIVIAVEAPLSGPQAANGKDMLRGVRLAARQANANGGVLGRQVEVVPVDDKANPDLARASVQKAAKAGAVAVIGPYNSSVGVANLPLYLDRRIVPVHMTSSNDTDGQGVTVQPKNDQISPVEFAFVKASSAASVAMLVDPSLYTQEMADRLTDDLLADGVAVRQIPIIEGQADYTAEVSDALASDPDLIYVSTYFPEGTKIAVALEAASAGSATDPTCLMGLANVDPGFIAQTSLTQAQRCSFSGIPTAAQMPGARAAKFVKEYRSAFDKEPGVWGIFTYDSANVLFAAIEQAGSTAFAPVLKNVQKTKDFAGATGTITIDPLTGNRRVVPVYILTVDNRNNFIVDQLQSDARRLVNKMWTLAQNNDEAGLEAFINPQFQAQDADQPRWNKQQFVDILVNQEELSSYTLSDLRATRSGSTIVVTYTAAASQIVEGKQLSGAPKPRMTVFVQSPTTGDYSVMSHSSFNVVATQN